MRVTEIFFSIQGEGTRAGRPCVFVRFTGCDLRCGYCDTAYAFHGGREMTRAEIVAAVERHPCRFVLLTGGEPLLQRELPDLAYLDRLAPQDEVKFVVCSEEDFRWSADVVRRHRLEGRAAILFSPAWGQVAPADLVRWLLETGLDARLSLQIHKVVWGPEARGV